MNARLWKQLAIATNWPVLAAVFLLSAVGVLTIWADAPKEGLRQLIYLGIALLCMMLFQAVNYQKIGRLAWPFYCFSLLLILYTVIGGALHLPGVPYRNGAYNWIVAGPISLQPAELMKIAFVLLLARYLRFRSNYRTITGLLAPFALALVPIGLILKQPDFGTALIFIPALFAMLFVAGAKIKHLLAIVGMGVALIPLLWFSGQHVIKPDEGPSYVCTSCPNLPILRHLPQFIKHYQRDRVYAMFSSDPRTLQAKGFQQRRAEIAFGSGGWSGKGMGEIPIGRQVPEAHNDMIFALVGEQFGFFGAAVVLGAYIVLFTAGVEIASVTREPFGRLIALGVVSILAGQTFLNLMVATKLMPVTGVTLPFISYGGSSLLASFMAAGLLLNVGQNRPLVMAKDAFEFSE
jgi:cell division protein FtsW (lipid II flippase)